MFGQRDSMGQISAAYRHTDDQWHTRKTPKLEKPLGNCQARYTTTRIDQWHESRQWNLMQSGEARQNWLRPSNRDCEIILRGQ